MGISLLEEFLECGEIGEELLLGWGELVGVECVEPLAEGCKVVWVGKYGLKLLGFGSLGKKVEGSLAVGKGVCLVNGCRFVDYGRGIFR